MEKYVQTELAEVLGIWKSSGTEINASDFYGDIYVHSPESFKFTIGDRMQIQSMVNYVKMKYDENGVEFSGAHHFDPHPPKKIKLKCEKNSLKCFFSNSSTKTPADDFKCTENSRNHEKQILIDKISNIYSTIGIDSSIVEKLNTELVELQDDAEGRIRALFKCPLCGTSNKENSFVVHTKPQTSGSSSKNVYWVLSNYTKHVNKHVKNAKKNVSKIEMESSVIDSIAMNSFDDNGACTEANQNDVHSIKSHSSPEPNDDIIEESYVYDYEESIVDNSVEIVEFVSQPQSNEDESRNELESLIYTQITS